MSSRTHPLTPTPRGARPDVTHAQLSAHVFRFEFIIHTDLGWIQCRAT